MTIDKQEIGPTGMMAIDATLLPVKGQPVLVLGIDPVECRDVVRIGPHGPNNARRGAITWIVGFKNIVLVWIHLSYVKSLTGSIDDLAHLDLGIVVHNSHFIFRRRPGTASPKIRISPVVADRCVVCFSRILHARDVRTTANQSIEWSRGTLVKMKRLLDGLPVSDRVITDIEVALVIGANDVVNPAARHDNSSPLFGMPILDVDNAQTVFVLKRSMNPGFAGVENELFFNDNTIMLFGDAKETVAKLVSELK